MYRIFNTVQLGCWAFCVLAVVAVRGDEPGDPKVQKLFDESRSRAEGLEVKTVVGDKTIKGTLHATPLMKYTDVPRHIEMATLWLWHDEGRPVALGKVEAYQRPGDPRWLYCFTSASTGLVEGKWAVGRRFQAKKPGIEWADLKGPAPEAKASGRLRQMKELFRRFSATSRDDVLKTSDDLRPLARPLHEYASPKHGVVQGILGGFAANGTNPDVIVAIEAVSGKDDKGPPESWRYGVICMTAGGVSVKFDKDEVFTRAFARSPGDQDNWTYFWEDTATK